MKTYDVDQFVAGWFIGSFEPSVLKTDQFEVAYKKHYTREPWPAHAHKESTEINYLIRGQMTINNELLTAPVVFVIEKGELALPTFLSDCELIVVKCPSVIGDKYDVDGNKI
jgi:hypothetical protein